LNNYFQIEAALKACKYVDNICVCGGTFSSDLVAIITPNHKSLTQLAESLGKKEPMIKLCEDPDIVKKVYSSLAQTGRLAQLSKKEIPIKIKLVIDEWSPDNDMLTAAMKLKRKNVQNKYSKQIDKLFSTEDELNLNNTFEIDEKV
jgi:long-chain acyl-CoA synthetase